MITNIEIESLGFKLIAEYRRYYVFHNSKTYVTITVNKFRDTEFLIINTKLHEVKTITELKKLLNA